MNADEVKALESRYVLQTYARAPFVLERGEGVRLYDTEGRSYLDFGSGIAVNALGYGDKDVLAAISEQMQRLMHISNLYYSEPQVRLAQALVESSFADKVYFCNSGTEAVEAAIKFARKCAKDTGCSERIEFVAFSGAFHGRTMGSLALTPRSHYQDPYRPLMPGAQFATFNDLASAEALVSSSTCAVIVEPVQGEGGIHPADPAFLRGLRALCDRSGALLIFDEVQCGLGRTGHLWAHQPYGVTPDIMTLAKPLGGGLPMGATLVTQRVADVLGPGDHGSTFAANPVICAAAQVVVGKVSDDGFLQRVRESGQYLGKRLGDLQETRDDIVAIRGRGLMWGIELTREVAAVLSACQERGLLTLSAVPNVLRLLPPLTVQRPDLDEGVSIIEEALSVAAG